MDIRKLQRAIVDGLEDVKARDIVVFNTEHLSPLFERVVIASGTSNRQTKALASSVRETVKSRGLPVLSVEGADNGEWIIVDCGAAVAHIMQPAIREYYHLEEIWGGKPVKMKVDGVAPVGDALAKPDARPASAAAAGKARAVKPAAKPVKNAAAKEPAVKKPAAKKAAAKKAAPKKPASHKPVPTSATPKKTAPRKAASPAGQRAASGPRTAGQPAVAPAKKARKRPAAPRD